MSFPTDSVTDKMEESRGGLVVEVEGMLVGGAVVVAAAVVVVTEGAVTQPAVVKANPKDRDKRTTPNRQQYRDFLGSIAISPARNRAP
ncbi:hypothetical protein BH18ACT6_BH18ACT6_19220 [soil metagenome]